MIQARILKIVVAQGAITVCAGLLAYGLGGQKTALSSLMGGAVSVVSALGYALRSSLAKGNDPQACLAAQYAGERIKLFLTLLLVTVIALRYRELRWAAFILTYLATVSAYFGALLWDR